MFAGHIERFNMQSSRITDEFLNKYGDDEITKLVKEYYLMFDESPQARGGMQVCIEEVSKLKKFLGNRKFYKFLEIGVSDGGSLWLYANLFCRNESEVTSIDPMKSITAGIVLRKLMDKFKTVVFLNFDCVQVASKFQDNYFDFINLDADHEYLAVKNNFDVYIKKLSDDGIMLIHDTYNIDGTREFMEKEIHANYDCIQFIGKGLASGQYQKGEDIMQCGTTLISKRKGQNEV